jgi:hypothetical protein
LFQLSANVTLTRIVIDIFRDRPPEEPPSDGNQSVEAFLFDGPHKAFGEGVGIWRSLGD